MLIFAIPVLLSPLFDGGLLASSDFSLAKKNET